MIMDAVNGAFELGGALSLCLSVHRLWRDREIRGVHWAPTVYFFLWGAWNCLYYPSLGQWWSFVGGLGILAANCAWLGSLLWFTWRRARDRRAGLPGGPDWIPDHPNCRCVMLETDEP